MNTKRKQLIFIICYLAYTSIYIARLNLSMSSVGLIDEKVMDAAQIGMLGSMFSVVYAIGRLLNGTLSDKYAPWIMICTGLIIAGVSNLLIGVFPPFIGILLLWGANAYAQSMLWSSVLCIVSAIYDEKTAKKKTSYIVTSVAVGNIIGIVFNTWIITKFGVRFAFIIPGGLTLVMSTLIFAATHSIKNIGVTATKKHISVLKLFKEKEIKICVLPAVFHGVIKDNISLWMAVYFVNNFGIDLKQSAYFSLFIPIVGFIGRVLYPGCYKLLNEKEHKISFLSFIICAVLSVPLCFAGISPIIASLCLSLIYTMVSMINTSMLSMMPLQYSKSGNVASVSGIMDFLTYFGAGIGSIAYGTVIKYFGYTPMFVSWIVISGISVIIMSRLLKKN
ncbi:MAG: MFS transporter [Clostridia bacterium]|nr:MFS transporter [Clostridia bacterium]